MDYENFTPNLIFDDGSEANELPQDLDLDIWFYDADITEFLQAVQGLKRTRAALKDGHPAVIRAQTLLEERIISNSTLTWVCLLDRS